MPSPLEEFGRPAWEFAWGYTGRTDAGVAALARAFRAWESSRPPREEPERRRAFWRTLADACRQQASACPPGAPESAEAPLARVLDLPLELREALLLIKFHGASAEDLGAILGCPPEVALARARRALMRIALVLASSP